MNRIKTVFALFALFAVNFHPSVRAETVPDLPALTTGSSNDLVYVINVNDTTDGPGGSGRKMTFGNFFSSMPLGNGMILVGGTGGTAIPQTPGGDLSMSNSGTFTLATVATSGTYSLGNGSVVLDAKGRVLSVTPPTNLVTTSSVVVTGTNVLTDSLTGTLGTAAFTGTGAYDPAGAAATAIVTFSSTYAPPPPVASGTDIVDFFSGFGISGINGSSGILLEDNGDISNTTIFSGAYALSALFDSGNGYATNADFATEAQYDTNYNLIIQYYMPYAAAVAIVSSTATSGTVTPSYVAAEETLDFTGTTTISSITVDVSSYFGTNFGNAGFPTTAIFRIHTRAAITSLNLVFPGNAFSPYFESSGSASSGTFSLPAHGNAAFQLDTNPSRYPIIQLQ